MHRVIALAALLLPALSVAAHPRERALDPPVIFLPGADLGLSPHALWQEGLVLGGVQGGHLVVDEAMVLRVQQRALSLVVRAEPIADADVEELTLEFRRPDGSVAGVLDLASPSPRVDLGGAEPGDSFGVGAALALAPEAPLDARIVADVWADASVAPDA